MGKNKIKKNKNKINIIDIEKLNKYKKWEEVSKDYNEKKINSTELLYLLEVFKLL